MLKVGHDIHDRAELISINAKLSDESMYAGYGIVPLQMLCQSSCLHKLRLMLQATSWLTRIAEDLEDS